MSSDQISYRQALAAALQKLRTTGTYAVGSMGPEHATRWYCTFSMQGQVVGQSGECTSKATAKEQAAQQALLWLKSVGYDVA